MEDARGQAVGAQAPRIARSRAGAHSARGGKALPSAARIVEFFPYGILTLDGDGVMMAANGAARDLLGDAVQDLEHRKLTCCDLFACGGAEALEGSCLTKLALERGAALPEIRLDIESEGRQGAVWVTAAPLGPDDSRVLLHLRPGDPRDRRRRTAPHWTGDRRLEITCLGRTQVRSAGGALNGNWLTQRSGQLLKYLLSQRHRVVFADEIAEALWPGREQGVLNNVRYFVHALRDKLEPDRTKRSPSSFILSEASGYRLNLDLVDVDADRFERSVRAGRAAAAEGNTAEAKALLEEAMTLYRGDFVSDDPYALWALNERDRLRALAAEALETLTAIAGAAGDTAGALARLEQLAHMYPFDPDVERRLIALALQLGQQTFARRRYAAFRIRLLREFGQPPDFDLSDLVREIAADSGSLFRAEAQASGELEPGPPNGTSPARFAPDGGG